MQTAHSGGRRLTMAALASRRHELEDGRSVSRKELSSVARDAAKALSLRPTLRLVLDELVACWGEQPWDRLLVWPSNEHLVSRTGLSERAIRISIRSMIELQLLAPKDSANGKRFAVRDRAGEIVDAFGFDLTPIYARRGEWVTLLAEQKQARDACKRMLEEITICRRAVEEALSAIAERFPTHDIGALENETIRLRELQPRRSAEPSDELLGQWKDLRKKAEETFYELGNAGTRCRHNETNNGSPSEPCNKGSAKEPGLVRQTEQVPSHLSVESILEACPALLDAYDRPVRDHVDLVHAGRYLRASIGAHESAWREATERLGSVRAAIAVVYVLQLHSDDVSEGTHRIQNPGGYFRALVRLIGDGRVDLDLELMTLRRKRMT